MPTTVERLASLVGGEVHGDASREIVDGRSIDRAGPEHVIFVGTEANLKKLPASRAGAALIGKSLFEPKQTADGTLSVIVVDDAQRAFLTLLEHFRPRRRRPRIGISPGATVDQSAKIGENTNVFPGAWIGENAVIGRNCDIHPGVVVGAGCVIGDGVTLYPHVVLYADVTIGDRAAIHAGAVIGADGFGYRLRDGRQEKIPHFGTVRIDADVEIGACATIDRAMIGETVIGEGTKIDNLVMVAHNCELGKHNVLTSQVGLAGSVTSGDYVVCAGQVGIADHVHLGTGCVLGSRSGVHKDIPPGETQIGAPSQPAAEAMKVLMAQRKLPALLKTVRNLEAQVAALAGKLAAMEQREDGGAQTGGGRKAA
jgi:UDP-3-O-[3-hydroxymyristoyl] glucosamine N-acyltransferase